MLGGVPRNGGAEASAPSPEDDLPF